MRVLSSFPIATCLAALLVSAAPALAQHGPPPPRPDIKPGEPTPWTRLLIEAIETAHGATKLREHGVLEVEITFAAQDHPSFEGTLRLDTAAAGRRARLDRADGVTLLDDGKRWWMVLECEGAADGEEISAESRADAIFYLKALPRFVGMPFRMHDPAVLLIPSGRREVGGAFYHAVSMTFPENDDWLGVFAHRFEDRMEMISYFIRTPATGEPAVGLPPAYVIEFSDFEKTEGVSLARTWTLRRWHRVDGPQGEPIGKAKVKSVRLGELDPAIFEPPAADPEGRRLIIDLTPEPAQPAKESSEEPAESPVES